MQGVRLQYRQLGMSLIGLLIGMLLSVVSLLAAMSMYHSLVDTAIDTKVDAKHDGNIATAMLTIQLELQNAGRFLDDAANNDLMERTDSDGVVNAIYWRYSSEYPLNTGFPHSYRCARIVYQENAAATFNELAIEIAASDVCKPTTGTGGSPEDWFIASPSWGTPKILARFPVDTAPEVVMSIQRNHTCWPYGRSEVVGQHQQVTIDIQSAASRATKNDGTPIASTAYKFCLPNMAGDSTVPATANTPNSSGTDSSSDSNNSSS